ncbi:hypothetical protein [Bacillus safensis]|uniref:hypothetical protein n=1 Tax=Bacillus safensis TaxID=561879 RepID=UPI001CD3894F|nr:hypothetical protein [Bacillus safensis]
MTTELTLLKKLLDEITTNNLELTNQYEAAKQQYELKRAKADIFDRIAQQREIMGYGESDAFKEHFQIHTLKEQVEEDSAKFEAVEKEYIRASRFNNEVISTLKQMVGQEEHS